MANQRENGSGRPQHHLREVARLEFGSVTRTATELHKWLVEEVRGGRLDPPAPSLRAVQQWASEWTDPEAAKAYVPPEDWAPWTGQETSEESAYLFKLDLLTRAWWGRSLNLDEANWACRIRAAVTGLEFFVQWALVELYAEREALSKRRGWATPETRDLDDIIAIKPWEPGGEARMN